MKRILDTVHGYIMVDDKFIHRIIDTVYFQRLRRIEQTSIRSVYPSARHDRFIHSLGVYHIGSLIVEHLMKEEKSNRYWGENETTLRVMYDSFLAACLLHDIGHAPFSHTFEKYYGQKSKLAQMLSDAVQNEEFRKDLEETRSEDEPNFHEYMSAYIAYEQYGEALREMVLDPEFVARMITGIKYQTRKDTHQVYNCFISLLHGKIIDADRLDYACRDVWASGYSTSSIDLRRLISALHMMKDENGKLVVCFEANSLNEIEGVLNVKDFQVRYVLNHHVVSYEQWLLRKAAEQMALKYFPNQDSDGYEALSQIICKNSVMEGIDIPNTDLRVKCISDDDLIFLLKQDRDNAYYEAWSSRQYAHVALWKSPDEFYHLFPGIERNKNLQHHSFKRFVTTILTQKYQISSNEVIVTEAEYRPRVKMDTLNVIVTKELTKYTDLYPEAKNKNENVIFYYVFIPKVKGEDAYQLSERKRSIINELRPVILTLYKDSKINIDSIIK